jgi:hypothetical protein
LKIIFKINFTLFFYSVQLDFIWFIAEKVEEVANGIICGSRIMFFPLTGLYTEQMKYWFIAEKVEEVASGIICGSRSQCGSLHSRFNSAGSASA